MAVHADAFVRLVDSVTRVNGMPTVRRAYVPTPVAGKSAAELRSDIAGLDPVTGRAFVSELVDGLTRPLSDDDLTGVSFERSMPRLLAPADDATVQQLFLESGWTDYLPVTLPTEERVAAMLAGTSRRPDEIVGRLRPTNYREYWEFSVEKVAVNAVMAGALPEHLPVILALAATGATGRHSTTSSMGFAAVVNGPIRHEISMNSGIGALGPYAHANAAIARAYSLLSQNLQGGSVPGETYMGALGNMVFCSFAENEEASPWEPLHVTHGFDAETSTVTVYGVWGMSGIRGGISQTWQEKAREMIGGLDPFGTPLMIVDPTCAQLLVDHYGYHRKGDLAAWIAEASRRPARVIRDHHSWIHWLVPLARDGVEPFATQLNSAPDDLVPMYRPEDVDIVVVGGGTVAQFRFFDALRSSLGYRTVSVDEWR